VNPLAVTTGGTLVSLDCKVNLDPGAIGRHPNLQQLQADVPMVGTPLEQMAAAQGLLYIELDGNVGVLANGAGLTMATLDAVAHYGGRPANFLEIGGDAYTRAETALRLVLSNPNVKSLLVNFCGAFARTDIMVGGLVDAIEAIQPTVPISFSIHGTGEDQAIRLVRERLALNPHPLMDDAVREAVEASRWEAGG
jgi:succinyl-CoA synthetase beta subunit